MTPDRWICLALAAVTLLALWRWVRWSCSTLPGHPDEDTATRGGAR